VRALLRRRRLPLAPAIVRVGPLELDTRARRVSRGGKMLHLSAREYALLEYLAMHVDAVVGRATLTEHVWEASEEPASNAIDVCIRRLRQKLDKRGQPSLIVTRRGEGYMLSAEPQR
jgi:DNA-binding response OmpR family regulator